MCGSVGWIQNLGVSAFMSLNREHRTEKCAGDDGNHPGYRINLKAHDDANITWNIYSETFPQM